MKQKYEKPVALNIGDILPVAMGNCSNGSVANSWSSSIPLNCSDGSLASLVGPNCVAGGTA